MRKLLAVLACTLALAAAACAKPQDDGLASAGGPAGDSDKQQVSNDPAERMRQFAQCMRDNGVDMPDPQIVEGGEGGQGDFKVEMRQGEGGPGASAQMPDSAEMEKFKKAEESCKAYLPEGGMLGKADPEMQEKMRQMAKCMRENGFENFPDPQEGGGIAIGPESGIDPRDPKFQEAQKKCDELAGFTGERKTTEGKPAT